MRALIDAEVLKLRSTRLLAGLLFGALCLVVLTVVVNVPTVGHDDRVSLDDPALLAGVVGVSVAVPQVLVCLLGVLAFTQEFRYGTASSMFLATPRRTSVLAAKWIGLTLASVPITVGTILVSVTVGIPLIRSRDGSATAGAELWQVVVAAVVVLAACALIGVGIGAIVRNQIAAVVGVLVWMLAVEQILVQEFPSVGRWTPVGATFGMLQLGPLTMSDGTLLDPPIGGLVLAGYTTVVCVLAVIVMPRRDVL